MPRYFSGDTTAMTTEMQATQLTMQPEQQTTHDE